jgi:uncharacterized protein (DUF58 family)
MDRRRLLSRAKTLRIVSSKLLEGLLSGTYRSVFKGPGIEFDEVREYAESDDIRAIDWNVTSRMGTPYTKTFREEREILLYLVMDVSGSMFSGAAGSMKIDVASEVAALVVYSAVQNNDRVGGVFFSDVIEKWIPPSKGKSHGSRMVRDLGSLDPVGIGSDIGLGMRTAYETMKRRGICVVVSDFRSAAGLTEAALLARKHDVIAIRIIDDNEYVFPVRGYVELRDPESGKSLPVLGSSGRFRREYRDFWRAEHAVWQQSYRRRGISTITISTDEDPAERLIHFFRARGKR